ncbi:hypothetical protein Dimus_018526 [Dionaea muscipula]
MLDNGLSNVMDLIKRQRWEKLFKRRELMHIDAVKEFYARLTLAHYKKKDVARYSLKRENGIWWLGSGENRRRDDDMQEVNDDASAANVVENEEAQNQPDFDWEEVGESRSDNQFFNAQVEVEESAAVVEEVPEEVAQASDQQKEIEVAGVDPSGPSRHILDSVMNKLQAEFKRARANRIQADLEKA